MKKLAIGCLLSVTVASLVQPASADTWAVVVGVDHYQNESVTSLRYAGADAHLFADTLVATGVKSDHIFLYTTDSPKDRQPTRLNLLDRLGNMQGIVGPKDSLIFYFAGHGINVEQDKTFLMTQEADARSLGTLKVTSLDGQQMKDLVEKTSAANSLVILDACRNDPTSGRGDEDNKLNATTLKNLTLDGDSSKEKNRATLYACSTGERSYEAEELKHGYFTYWLTEGMRKAASTDGRVTLQTLSNYLTKEVPKGTLHDLGKSQDPILKYEGPNENAWVLNQLKPTAIGKVTPQKNDSVNQDLIGRYHRLESEKTAWMAEQRAVQRDNARLIALVGALNGLDSLKIPDRGGSQDSSSLGRGRSMMLQSNYREASVELSSTLKAQADNYPARLLRGVSRLQGGDARGAIEDLSQSIQQDPAFWPAYWYRALAREQASDAPGALADYGHVVEMNPNFSRAYRKRARLRAGAGNTVGADEDKKKADKLDSDVRS